MATTTNFSFTLLDLNDTAGYSSINTLIQSVDNKLRYRTITPGMIVIMDTTFGSVPTGWDNLTGTVTGLPTLSSPYVYARKTTTL